MTKSRTTGFSLTEVLLAVATLTIGMVFIGGTFFVGMHYSTRSVEQGMGAVVAREAVSLIRLYGMDLADPNLSADKVVDYTTVAPAGLTSDTFVYLYNPQYRWDAVCQRVPGTTNLIAVTVFISRWIGDEDNPPQLRTLDVTVDDRFLDPDQPGILAHGSHVVDGQDIRRIYEVTRSQADATDGVRWELVPDPNRVDPGGTLNEIWTVAPDATGSSETESRIVYVTKDEIRI